MKKTSNAIRFETRVPLERGDETQPDHDQHRGRLSQKRQKPCATKRSGASLSLRTNKPIGIVTEEDINCKVVAKDLKPSTVHGRRYHEYATHYGECGQDGRRRRPYDGEAQGKETPGCRQEHKVIGIVTVRDLLTVSNEHNELLTDLIEINREEISRWACAAAAARCLMILSGWTM